MPDGSQNIERVAPPEDHRALRDAFGRFSTMGPEGPVGFTANSFSSLSLDPALVLWSPAKSSRRFAIFAGAAHYAIHVLADDQAGLIHRFTRTGEGFSGLDHRVTEEGVPTIAALARFDCAAHAVHDGGDHAILVGRVLRVTLRDGAPLVFSQGRYGGFAG
jgi:flavin reductase (DIM6/NTAB) family NADH-FMN oxidoreductase RutF